MTAEQEKEIIRAIMVVLDADPDPKAALSDAVTAAAAKVRQLDAMQLLTFLQRHRSILAWRLFR